MADASGKTPPEDQPADLAEDIHRFLDDVDDLEAVHRKMKNGEFEKAYEMMGLTPAQAESVIKSWRHRALNVLLRRSP